MNWSRLVLYVLPLTGMLALAAGLYLIVKDAERVVAVERQVELQGMAETLATLIADDSRFNLLLSGDSSTSYFAEPVGIVDLDGRIDDWPASSPEVLGLDYLIEVNDAYAIESLNYELRVGADTDSLFLHLGVRDDTVVYREINNLSVHRNDHVQIAFLGADAQFRRYTIATFQPGHVEAMEIGRNGRALRSEALIMGRWLATEAGYNLEIQLPLRFLNDRFSIVVADVDDEASRSIRFLVGKSATRSEETLGYLVTGVTPLQQLVEKMPWSAAILDREGELLAGKTDIQVDSLVAGAVIESAGSPIGEVRLSSPRDGLQGMTAMHSKSAFFLLLACLVLGLGTLVLVARQLDQRLEVSRREIEKIRQYNEYLERMASRLNHELQTPLSVIRSSLDHLASEQNRPLEQNVYVERATEGARRLTNILNKMSEARRLEEALDEEEITRFNLVDVVKGCVSGYELAFPQTQFDLLIEDEDLPVTGIPELIAQAFDKLIDNAVEFSSGDMIRVRLNRDRGQACLRVLNEGPALPDESADSLYESMVSYRKSNTENHLGLGLYVARSIVRFHGGELGLKNRDDIAGVVAAIRLPILRLTARLS